MAGYFAGRIQDLYITVKEQPEALGLRSCQMGAYWAIQSHFTAHDEPAIVSLPTGAGKTALMMLLAFGFNAHRVLVICPSDILRTQTYNKFRDLDGLVKAGVVDQDYEKPEVHKLIHRVTHIDSWGVLEPYDVIVGLPDNVSPEYNRADLEDIVLPPEGFFDIVFFDEAHYLRAPSWKALLDAFQNVRCILLTATPFRRDRRVIPGRLAYFYPLDKAMDARIYHPVDFQPVVPRNEAHRDEELAEQAIQKLAEVRERYHAKMLIRTDRIQKARELERLYNRLEVSVEAVHSRRTTSQNERTLEDLRSGELDGVVAVGQLGEGLDMHDLKIAVFHDPPKSFPFTVQLIGRLARPIDVEEIQAWVIADPNQLRTSGVAQEVRRLYLEDKAWKDLIPDLVEEFAGHLVVDAAPHTFGEMTRGVDPRDLNPYFSTRLYRVEIDALDFEADLKPDDEYIIWYLPQIEERLSLGLLTCRFDRPSWAGRTHLQNQVFDLHLYYYHGRSRTLFESTTYDAIGSKIRASITSGNCERLGGEELVRVMQSEQYMDYLVAGLANALGPSGALPSYKMLLGNEVQGAINPSDIRTYVRGHVVARMFDGETRGISDSQGRVWSMKRGGIDYFVEWCNRIGDALVENQAVETVQGLEFLGSTQRVYEFPNTPLLVLMNPRIAPLSVQITHTEWAAPVHVNNPYFVINGLVEEENTRVRLSFFPTPNTESIELVYAVDVNHWSVPADDEYTVIVEDVNNRDRFSCVEFFQEYAPYFYLDEGLLLVDGRVQKLRVEYEDLPEECFIVGTDWSSCDVTIEYAIPQGRNRRLPADGMLTVHEWLELRLEDEVSERAIVYKDHGKGEAADYIVLDLNKNQVGLYHVKAAPRIAQGPNRGEVDIGATLSHVKEVLDQVLRSVAWIKSRRLVDHIIERHARNNQTDFVIGQELFEELSQDFTPTNWDYRVYLVNPGLNQQLIAENANANVNIVLLSCYEWLRGIDCELRIMGFCEERV